MTKKENDTYEIGYGKPPKSTQFQPGQSGNRKGRPKRSKNTVTLLEEILCEKITVREGDRTRSMSCVEAILHTLKVKALKGDPKATQMIMSLLKQAGMFEPEKDDKQSHGGVLVVPEQMGVAEWMAAEKARLAKQADERE